MPVHKTCNRFEYSLRSNRCTHRKEIFCFSLSIPQRIFALQQTQDKSTMLAIKNTMREFKLHCQLLINLC